MSAPLVALRDVSLGYNGQAIIEHVTFSVERGEFVALLGPNGAGKTTLLRGMLGLNAPLAGRIEYGFDRLATPPGYVPQRDRLDPIFPLSAYEVVLMGTYAKLPAWRWVGRAQRQLATACLAEVGLGPQAHDAFCTMSGGQKQRVLIARALATQPQVMFLDEPTAGVDRDAEAVIIELITKLNHDKGLTVVLVSHHLERIEAAVQAVVWVDERKATKGPLEMVRALAGPAGLIGALDVHV